MMVQENVSDIKAIVETVVSALVDKAVEKLLVQLPDRLRPMVRQELERPCCAEHQSPFALRAFGLPSEPPITPLSSDPICGTCGEPGFPCGCPELRRHD